MTDKKRKKKRLNGDGSLRIPKPAIAYFFDLGKRLVFIYPSTGEHPDKTIKRVLAQSGMRPSPSNVRVTERYFDMVQDLPKSALEVRDPVVSVFDPPAEEE